MPEGSSLEAALLELFATATRARIIPADRLQRGNKRLGSVWSRPTDILTTDGVPLLFSVGCIRESGRPGEESARRSHPPAARADHTGTQPCARDPPQGSRIK